MRSKDGVSAKAAIVSASQDRVLQILYSCSQIE